MRKIQNFMKSTLGFTMPVFFGRGVFNSRSFGFLPKRRPIRTVVCLNRCLNREECALLCVLSVREWMLVRTVRVQCLDVRRSVFVNE